MPSPPFRNAPCSCGSGKRYKDCHGALGESARAPQTADELFGDARLAFASGRGADARALLERALELAPQRAELSRELARIEWALGDERAAATCRAAIDRAPADVTAWNLLGEILRTSDPTAAEQAWRHALRLEPSAPEANFHLGNLERERGNPRSAIAYYQRSLQSAPGHPGVLNNLGLALEGVGNAERAEACYREVLAVHPADPDALANLACIQYQRSSYRDAAATYERAFALRRNFPPSIWGQRAAAQAAIGAFGAAEAGLREAARLAPDHLQTHIDIGSMCLRQGKYLDAEAAFSRALELDARHPYACTMRVHSRQQLCLWDGLDDWFSQLAEVFDDDSPWENGRAAAPFPLLAMPLAPRALLRAAQRWAKEFTPPIPAAAPIVTRDSGERLRVGFVSSDFREHPTAYLLMDFWERIDRTRIEAFAYSLVPTGQGPIGQRVAAAVEHIVDVSEEPTTTLAARIRADRIGVLFDLNGYTAYARSELFALRPAPVQINWLGYLGTLGADWYDYIITDRCATPEALQPFFTERFLYLPDCYCPTDTERQIGRRTPTRDESGLPAQGLVFCSFNSPYKILPAVFNVWMRLLAQVPASVLWLSPDEAAMANLRNEAAARGVDPQRLIFAPRIPLAEHLARHAHVDLFLDTTPYNAGTTANDALFMDVPVITCAGPTMASRVAASQLEAIGLPELATTSLADYEGLAMNLARNPDELAALRARLMANRQTHPLFDMATFARNLEDALDHVWRNYTSRKSAR